MAFGSIRHPAKHKMILSYVRITRPLNLAMIALFMWVMYDFWIINLLNQMSADMGIRVTSPIFRLTSLDIILLILATVLIAAGGNVINDYYDVEADKINKPKKTFVGEKISRKSAFTFAITLFALGIILGGYIAWKSNHLAYVGIFIASALLLWLYSYALKRIALLGNLTVSLLAGLVPLMVWIFIFPLMLNDVPYAENITFLEPRTLNTCLMFALVAFVVTLIRELVKDLADVEGDAKAGCKTAPIVFGVPATKIIVILLGLAVISSIVFVAQHFPLSVILYAAIVLAFFAIGLVLVVGASDSKRYSLAGNMIKVAMLFVILYGYYLSFIFPIPS